MGCGINFAIGDILGRRRMIWLAMVMILIGATLQTSAFKLAHLIIGRIITGGIIQSGRLKEDKILTVNRVWHRNRL